MKDKKTIHLDFNNMMADAIGSEHGITEQELKTLAPVANRYVNDVVKWMMRKIYVSFFKILNCYNKKSL